jgi:hypothetical protein
VESFGAYALTNNFEYQESGVPFLRCVNIKNGFVSFGDCLYIDEEAHKLLHKSAVSPETVLLTMSGSVGNAAVALPEWSYPINSNQDIAKIRTRDVNPYYLAAFLGSRYGQLQMERLPVGSVQQHIFLWMIEAMVVARIDPTVEARIGDVIRSAYVQRGRTVAQIARAEGALSATLGLADWSPPEPLSYSNSVAIVRSAGRLDAEYFAPRIRELIDRLGQQGQVLGDVAPSRREKFDASLPGVFEYIEISDLTGDGTTSSTRLERTEAPSRATWHVRPGDVVTSTVRPIRRLSALIEDSQDGFVCSSGFVVLRPERVRPEVLLTYLRLPVFCELMDLHTSASMYPAISEKDLLRLPFASPDDPTEAAICDAVRKARDARRRAVELIESARRAVEIAIEQDEVAALRFLDKAES